MFRDSFDSALMGRLFSICVQPGPIVLDSTLVHTTSPTVFHNSGLTWNKDAQQ